MHTRTAEEMLAANIETMGAEVGAIYSELWQRVVHLREVWSQYGEIFGSTAEKVELVNDAAATFFGVVQDALFETVVLGIARLTDRDRVNGKRTLTIAHLQRLSPEASQLTKAIGLAYQDTAFCRDWRNRVIAHTDLHLLFDTSAKPIAEATRLKIDRAILSLENVLNSASEHFNQATTLFEHRPPSLSGGTKLLRIIADGLAVREARLARWQRGGDKRMRRKSSERDAMGIGSDGGCHANSKSRG